MVSSLSDRDGSARRRPVPVFTSPSQTTIEAQSSTILKNVRRKRSRKGTWIVVAAFVLFSMALLFLATQQTTIQEPLPMIQSITQPQNDKLLALLYPPGLMGGYRNQVIRFLSFTVHALKKNISSILLPSIQWATQVGNSTQWVPIPMDLLMDIDHWNSFYPKLPLLVDYHAKEHYKYDCWHVEDSPVLLPANVSELTRQVVSRGFLTPIYNLSKHVATRQVVIHQRRTDLLPNVSHCRHPTVHGGGTMSGRLWNEYIRLDGEIPFHAQELVLQALRPRQSWRNVASKCVRQHTSSQRNNYIALHARVELDMMIHPCGKEMEKNFTKILDMVSDLSQRQGESMQGVFVAVGRSGMEHQETEKGYKRFKEYVDENLMTLNRLVEHGLQNGQLPVFECGRQALNDHYYSVEPNAVDYGSILQSMINFHVATEASIFVGVRGSSYSTDIWTTRYHQGKGLSNYEYTPNGIRPLENEGLPPPHSNCKNKH